MPHRNICQAGKQKRWDKQGSCAENTSMVPLLNHSFEEVTDISKTIIIIIFNIIIIIIDGSSNYLYYSLQPWAYNLMATFWFVIKKKLNN